MKKDHNNTILRNERVANLLSASTALNEYFDEYEPDQDGLYPNEKDVIMDLVRRINYEIAAYSSRSATLILEDLGDADPRVASMMTDIKAASDEIVENNCPHDSKPRSDELGDRAAFVYERLHSITHSARNAATALSRDDVREVVAENTGSYDSLLAIVRSIASISDTMDRLGAVLNGEESTTEKKFETLMIMLTSVVGRLGEFGNPDDLEAEFARNLPERHQNLGRSLISEYRSLYDAVEKQRQSAQETLLNDIDEFVKRGNL